MAAGIVTNKLTKSYHGDTAPALDGLDLTVKPGQIYGFLGANGAGKSTTIRLLLNFLQPTGGSAQIMGLDVVKDNVAVKKHVGYLSGDVALYQKATGRELFSYLAALQQTKSRHYLQKLEQKFEAQTNKPIAELSKGNRQKIGIIQALMHQPDVLILDEPTSGLDPLMQEVFYDCLREASARGAAVFMSSHNLVEAQRVCDRVGIIKHGKVIREQDMADSSELGGTIFRVTFAKSEALHHAKTAAGLKFLSQEAGNVALLQPNGSLSSALKVLSQFDIRELTTQKLDLEDEFMEFYGNKA